jgi:AraC-like DNA-binding protein
MYSGAAGTMRTIGQIPAESGFPADLATGWSWDIAQLADGLLDVERLAAPFEEGCIGSVTVDRTCLHQVNALNSWSLAVLPAPESGAVYVEGRRLLAGDVVLLSPGSSLELLSHAVGRIFLIAFPGAGTGGRARLRSPRWYSRTDSRAGCLSDDLRAWLEASNAGSSDSQRAHATRARLILWLHSLNSEAPRDGCEGPALSRRRMAVERVRRFIHEHLAETMTLAELCQHAHLQARSLEYGFRDLVGLSPFKYIKMLRLAEVRRRLQTSNPGERSVSELALDCGFCHLSQFAADYKRVFLESPSATRRAVERPGSPHLSRYEVGMVGAAAR